jgi:small subunit ribosomal protein S6
VSNKVRTGPKGAPNLSEVKEIVQTAGSLVLQQGGVIRSLANWGVFALPRAVSRNQMRHYNGHYFVMRYDASVATQEQVRTTLGLDPRVVRSTSVRLGDGKLGKLARFGGIEWSRKEG